MSENLNGVFDQGYYQRFDTRKDNMPDYLTKLAEQEKDFEPERVETIDLTFEKQNLTRASELNDDNVREK